MPNTATMEIATESRRAVVLPGDFLAEVVGDRLVLPREFVRFLRDQGVYTAEEFLSRIAHYPTVFATELGWTDPELKDAQAKLVEILRRSGKIDELYLQPPAPPRFGHGALDPATRRR